MNNDPTRPCVGGHGSPNMRRGSHLALTAGDVALAVTFKPSVASRCFPVNFSSVALHAACLFGGKRGKVILSVSFYNSKDASDVPSARLQTVIHYNIKRILRLTELTGKTKAGSLMSIDI